MHKRKARKGSAAELARLTRQVEKQRRQAASVAEAGELLRKRNAKLMHELTKIRKSQRQIIQRERLHALGQMASGIVHDFNNSLTPILGASDFLLNNPGILANKDEVVPLLESVRTAARDARMMVRRLRNFYKPDENVEVIPLDVNLLVEQVLMLTQHKWKQQARAKGATIRVKTDLQSVPPICANESHMREVLTNLIFNAVDAMPEGGTLTMSTALEDERVVIRVRDTGIGMSEDVRQRCFEPFFSTKGRLGTGMGLAMAYGAVHRYQGSIEAESELRKGTTIKISLPMSHDPVPGAAAATAGAPPVRPLKVLVVDDDTLSRGIITRYLKADGHSIRTAASSKAAMRLWQAGEYDLMVLDRIMPKVNGQALAGFVKKTTPKARVVLLTGYSDESGESEHLRDVDIVLDKPTTHEDLRKALHKILGEPASTTNAEGATPAATVEDRPAK